MTSEFAEGSKEDCREEDLGKEESLEKEEGKESGPEWSTLF